MTAILDPRKAWLAERRKLVTASDVPAILTMDARLRPLLIGLVKRDAIAVYADKVSDETDDAPTEAMQRGWDAEALIAAWYSRDTGRMVRDLGQYEIQRHPDAAWLGATLDRVTVGAIGSPAPTDPVAVSARELMMDRWDGALAPGTAPLQIKLRQNGQREWRDAAPLDVQIQVQVEAACIGAAWASACAWHGPGPLSVHDMPADRALIERVILPVCELFRWHVEHRIPPEPTELDCSRLALRRLFPGEDGETIVGDAAALELAEELETLRAELTEKRRRERELVNKLMRRAEGASFVSLPDGTFMERSVVEREAYEVKEGRYVTLRRVRPRRRE